MLSTTDRPQFFFFFFWSCAILILTFKNWFRIDPLIFYQKPSGLSKQFVSWPLRAHYILSWKSHHLPSWHPDIYYISSSPTTSGKLLWTRSVWGALAASESWYHLSLPLPGAQFTLAFIVFIFYTSCLLKVRDCVFCFVPPISFLAHGFDNYCSFDNYSVILIIFDSLFFW